MLKNPNTLALADEDWEQLVRGMVRTIAQLACREYGSLTRVAKATNLSKAAIADMKKSGKASIVSFVRVCCVFAKIEDSAAKLLLENPKTILRNLEPASDLDALLVEVRKLYSDAELAAWLKLLRDKHIVESYLGVELRLSENSGGRTTRKKIQGPSER